MNIQEFRQRYPVYDAIPDQELTDFIYNKYYKGSVDRGAFDKTFGVAFEEPTVASEPNPPTITENILAAFSPPNLLKQAETAGMIAGGALGGGAPVMGARYLAPALGAAIGKGTEQVVGQSTGIEPQQSIGQNLAQQGVAAATGALGEVAGQTGAEVLHRGVLAPFARLHEKTMAENATAQVAQRLNSMGVPISPELMAPSRTAKALNFLTSKIWPGSSRTMAMREKVMKFADDMAAEYGQQTGQLKSDYIAGATNVAQQSREKLGLVNPEAAAGGAFDKAIELMGGANAPLNLPGLRKHLESQLRTGKFDKIPFWRDNANYYLSLENPTVQDVRDLWGAVRAGTDIATGKTYNWNKLQPWDKTQRSKINNLIEKDLIDLGMNDASQALREARNMFYNQKLLGDVQYIFNRSIITPKGFDQGEAYFNPETFYSEYSKYRPKLINKFGENSEIVQNIDAFQNILKENAKVFTDELAGLKSMYGLRKEAVKPDLDMLKKQEKNIGAGMQNVLGGLASGAGGVAAYSGYISPMTAAGALGTLAASGMLANSMMAPKGIIKQWLTTGFKPAALPLMIKGGVQQRPNWIVPQPNLLSEAE